LIKFFAPILFITLFISCNNPHKVDKEKLSNPLVLKNGLLYSDSLSTTPFSGRHKSRMQDMKIEYEVVNGAREGDFIVYFPNDSIQMKGKMKNNKNSGEWKYFYPDGAIETDGFFEDDMPNGKWIWYNEKGKILEVGNFLNSNREGEWKSYDSTGRLNIVRIYKDNKVIDSTKVQ
jgi:antitoxin component YwqK of YwqJK toxin-antitoxin module